VHERIRSISHQGKQVFLADCSNCSALDVEKIMPLRNHVGVGTRGRVFDVVST